MCTHSGSRRSERLDKTILGIVALALPLLAATSSSADPPDNATQNACQIYAKVALLQVDIAIGLAKGGYGAGCRGAEGPRWSNKTEDHYDWCVDVPQAARDVETLNRRNFLKACAIRRKRLGWPTETDDTSCDNFSGGESCGFSPDSEGEGLCNALGNQIIESVEKINNDPSLLFDDARDEGLLFSARYMHYNHWRTFRCELRTGANNIRRFHLVGLTGGERVSKPSFPVPTTLPSEREVPMPSGGMKKLFEHQ